MDIENFPEVITELYAHTKKTLIAHQLNEDAADQIAIELAEHICQKWGGEPIYIPKGNSIKIARRNKKILAEFNGNNHSELCKRYNVSYQWLCQILKRSKTG